jgi:hypothetical protein
MRYLFLYGFLLVLLSSCAISKRHSVSKKYSPQELQKDFSIFRQLLEEEHPGLTWYTPADSMQYFFNLGASQLKDSMTEVEFRYLLSYITSKIKCGHTTVRSSKNFMRTNDTLRNRQFPLNIKFWKDTAVVTLNLHRKDQQLSRGSIITAINGRPIQQIIDSLFQFLSTDGYNVTHKYQTLSNRGVFSNMYLSRFGYSSSFRIDIIDTLGKAKTVVLPIYRPIRDSAVRIGEFPQPPRKLTRRERRKLTLQGARSLNIDPELHTAFMNLNTFTPDARLPSFLSRSFRKMKQQDIQNLVIDLRGNGGGSVTNSNLLTRYLVQKPFKIADTLFALKRNSSYGKYQEKRFFNWMFLQLMTRKRKDGLFHFPLYEKKFFKPKKKNHFNGQVYILSGGNSFSASTLVMQALRAQENVTIVGEESGGAAYGNNAWLIPDVTLPNTGVRFRLPLFRLVIDKDEQKGYGVQPEVFAPPTREKIMRNVDFKLEKVLELIKEKQKGD